MNAEHCLLPAPGRGGAKARANEMLTACDEPLELGRPAGVPPRQLESPRVQLPHEPKKRELGAATERTASSRTTMTEGTKIDG